VDYVITCIAKGGWDPLMCMDAKSVDSDILEGPWVDYEGVDEYQVPFGSVGKLDPLLGNNLQLNDVRRGPVTQFFDTWGDRAAVVNGVWMGSIVHQPNRIRILTGTTQSTNPDVATIFGHVYGTAEPLGSIDFSGLGYSGHLAASTGRTGHKSQIKALLDPMSRFPAPPEAGYDLPLLQTTEREDDRIREVLELRAEALRTRRGDGGSNDRRIDDLLASLDRRERLVERGAEIVEPLDLGGEPSFDLQASLAATLLDQGMCRAVTLQHFSSWDTHKSNILQHERYSSFFGTVNRLLADLQARGLLDRTLVMLISEMGRTPRRNKGLGKDHWGHATQILVGPGIRGGQIYGETNDMVESMRVDLATGDTVADATGTGGDLLKYDNLAAGLVAHLGIDPGEWFPQVKPFMAFSS